MYKKYFIMGAIVGFIIYILTTSIETETQNVEIPNNIPVSIEISDEIPDEVIIPVEIQDNSEIQDEIQINTKKNADMSDINTIVQNQDCDAMVALSFGEFLSVSKQYQQELATFLEDHCQDAVPDEIIPPDFDDILNRSDCDAIYSMTFSELSKATYIQQAQIANIVLGVSSIRC